MRSRAQWFEDFAGGRPDDFSPEERAKAEAQVGGIQADAFEELARFCDTRSAALFSQGNKDAAREAAVIAENARTLAAACRATP